MISKVKLAKGLCISIVTLLMAGDAMAARSRSVDSAYDGRESKRASLVVYIKKQIDTDGRGQPIFGTGEAVQVSPEMPFGPWRAQIKAENGGGRITFEQGEDVLVAEEVKATAPFKALLKFSGGKPLAFLIHNPGA